MLKVIIGNDVAGLYGIETKQVNEAVKNNPEKFPEGYAIELTEAEKAEVVENFDHLQNQKHSKTLAKTFTEKGLYKPATIVKSELPDSPEKTLQCFRPAVSHNTRHLLYTCSAKYHQSC